MVAGNPLFQGRWTLKKFNATVVNDIWPEVLFFTLIATMVSAVSELTPHKLAISNQLLTVLGTVLGLVISFRTSSAYERYQDGRKMWTNIMVGCRNLAQQIWIHVPNERKGNKPEDVKTLEAIIEKKTMINLIQAFAVSVKHFLRGEPGVYYQDLYPLISFLPRYASNIGHHDSDMLPLWAACHDPNAPGAKIVGMDEYMPANKNPRSVVDEKGHPLARTTSDPTHSRGTTLVSHEEKTATYRSISKSATPTLAGSRRNTFDPEAALPDIESHRPLRPARNPPKTTLYDFIPLFRFVRWVVKVIAKKNIAEAQMEERRRRKKLDTVESNVPLEIILVLSSYTAHLMRNGLVQPAIATGVSNNITLFQDTLSNLDRIRNTPLPFAYQAHLRISLWLYLLFLPFQIYTAFGWYTIPGTAFASFLLLGFLEIGQEIENPFNYDLNDLDLDAFCLSIQRELHEITAYVNPEPTSFVFSPWNQPFAPTDRRNAVDIMKGAGNQGLYKIPLESGSSHGLNAAGHHAQAQDMPESGLPSVKRVLVSNWKEIDEVTRHF